MKRHLTENNNLIGTIKAYETSLPYINSHPELDTNLFERNSSVWLLASAKSTTDVIHDSVNRQNNDHITTSVLE